jgi:hypothetical protein
MRLFQGPPQTQAGQDAARRLSSMRAWCSHCRAGVDNNCRQHVGEHGALIGRCDVLPSETLAAPCWHPQEGPVPNGLDITRSSCWRSAAVRRFPRQHNASDSRVPFPEADTDRRSQGQPWCLSLPSPCSALTGGRGSWRCLVRSQASIQGLDSALAPISAILGDDARFLAQEPDLLGRPTKYPRWRLG